MELSSGPAAQSRHHLRTVQTTAGGIPFSGSTNTALCKLLKSIYLLIYLLSYIHGWSAFDLKTIVLSPGFIWVMDGTLGISLCRNGLL